MNSIIAFKPYLSVVGEWSSILRVQQQMVLEHYPQRYDMLNAMEYLWWIPPGPIPDKYFEPLQQIEAGVLQDQNATL